MAERTSLADLTGEPHAEVFETGRPRTVRLSLDAGEAVPAHTHPDHDVVFHVVSGSLVVGLDGEPVELGAGDLLRFDGRREVAPRGADDGGVAVVVLAPKPAGD